MTAPESPARLLRGLTSPLDLAIAGVLATWALIEAATVPDAPIASQLIFAIAVTAPLIVRRRFPATVLLVIAVVFVLQAATSGPHATFNPFPSLLVATFTVATHVAPLWRSALLAAVPIATMLGAHVLGYFGSPGIERAGALFLFFFVGGTWTAGRVVRQRGLAVARTQQDVDRLASEAVSLERARIARELHDVVAHAVSVVVLQAGAAEQFLDKDTERARKHLAITRRTAQEALEEMRHLLGVLREDDALYAPQPGLDRIADLAEEMRNAGHPTQLDTTRMVADVPDGLSLAGYRIVQEALTNVRKHAPGAEVEVTVQTDEDRVAVTVRNGPPRGVPTAAEGGYGIAGMRERVRVYSGRFEAGPTAEGGWMLQAELPLVRS